MYEKITLPNGVRILFENIPHVRSVAAGIWVGTGSRHETEMENGASHFIEHMVFKGTHTRSAADIAEESDWMGGQLNAFTTKECTCFYGHVLDEHLRRLMDLLCDMVFNTKFDEEDVKNERGVIFEEIDMYEDTPEDVVIERLYTKVFDGYSLARPILGTRESLSTMTGESLRAHMRRHYRPENIVVAISGSFTAADIDHIRASFEPLTADAGENINGGAQYTPAVITTEKAIEQNHICLIFPSKAYSDPDRYAKQLFSSILGGGMSSRLFQAVREDRGLCYNICTYGSSYHDTGLFGVYTALSSDTEREAIKVICDELKRFNDSGCTDLELERAREQMKSNVLMSLESTTARMNRLGRNELYLGEIPTPEEVIERYNSVTTADVLKACRESTDFSLRSFSAVGKVAESEEYVNLLSL